MSQNFENILSLFNDNKFRLALEQLNNFNHENQKDFKFYFYRGIANLKLNYFDKATFDFNKCLSLNSNSAEVHNNLGILNYRIGKNELAIRNFLKSIEFKKDYKSPILALINVLTHTKNLENYDSKIIDMHNKINNINLNHSLDEHIDNNKIKKILKNVDDIIDEDFKDFQINSTQIFRREKIPLDCERHHKVFKTYEIIPKFCFNCFKVLIELNNVLDLIKLFIIFDNIRLINSNTRKCMIELRPYATGKYKGLIYCDTLKDSENILEQLTKICKKHFNKDYNCKIKKGCTEFSIKYPNYDTLENDGLEYNNVWEKYENIIDENNPDLSFEKVSNPIIKGMSLSDGLIIRNWLCFAKLIGDKSYEIITDKTYKSKFLDEMFLKKLFD